MMTNDDIHVVNFFSVYVYFMFIDIIIAIILLLFCYHHHYYYCLTRFLTYHHSYCSGNVDIRSFCTAQ